MDKCEGESLKHKSLLEWGQREIVMKETTIVTAEGIILSRRPWYTFVRLVFYIAGIVALFMLMCSQSCGSDETAPSVMVAAGGDAGSQPADDNNGPANGGGYNSDCSDEVEATLWVNSLYGGQVVCGSSETHFEEAVEVSGICMSDKGFSFVVYTEGNSTFTAAYEDGRPATLEFRVGTAPPQLQSELVLDWGAVTVVTVP